MLGSARRKRPRRTKAVTSPNMRVSPIRPARPGAELDFIEPFPFEVANCVAVETPPRRRGYRWRRTGGLATSCRGRDRCRYEVRRIEGRLSNFGETVSVIRIQHDSASEQISRSASSLCVALVTKSKPVEALGQPALERLAARFACAARVDRFRSSSVRRPGCSYFLHGLLAVQPPRPALIEQTFGRWAERQRNSSKFRRSRLKPATTESTPRFRRQKLLKVSSLTNTSVIRVAKLRKVTAQHRILCAWVQMRSPTHWMLGWARRSQRHSLRPSRCCRASVLSDGVVRASALNSERRRVLNERRDTKMVQ